MAETLPVELLIPCDPQYLSVVRLVVAGIGGRAGLTIDDIDDLKVAVSEACTNTIDHAFADGEGAPQPATIMIRFAPRQGELRIEVEDVGQGFDPDRVPVRPDQPPSLEGGLGLYLIHQLTDSVEVQSAPGSGTKVIMTKRAAR